MQEMGGLPIFLVMADLEAEVRVSLDEMRILVLGTQLLIGFQFHAFFRGGLKTLPPTAKEILFAALLSLVVSLAMVITPIAYHRIAADGRNNRRVLSVATRCAGVALLPLALALGADVGVATTGILGTPWAIGAGTGIMLIAGAAWYGVEWLAQSPGKGRFSKMSDESAEPTTLADRITLVMTEARVVLPGTQALLGFQFIAVFAEPFSQLPQGWRIAHLASLLVVALSVVVLMAPAAFHRLAERGEESERLHRFASLMVMAGMGLLAIGLASEILVVASLILAPGLGAVLALLALALLLGCWFAYPLLHRRLIHVSPPK